MSGKYKKNPRILLVASIPEFFWSFYRGLIDGLVSTGWEVTISSSNGQLLYKMKDLYRCNVFPIEIHRKISIFSDLRSIFFLFRLLKKGKTDIVHVHTPKGALIGLTAALFAGVKNRIYTVHGLPLETANGFTKILLFLNEWIMFRLATKVIVVSHSLKKIIVQKKISVSSNLEVIGDGTACGIDIIKFSKNKFTLQRAKSIREFYHIGNDKIVLGFVGRINLDKGIETLLSSFFMLNKNNNNLFLMIVGGYDSIRGEIPNKIYHFIKSHPKIITTGHVDDVVPYYCAMDILLLPSRREGFNYALLEGASLELPVVTTYATGCVDAVDNFFNGFVVRVDDVHDFSLATKLLIENKELRRIMGKRGRVRVLEKFYYQRLVELHLRLYFSYL